MRAILADSIGGSIWPVLFWILIVLVGIGCIVVGFRAIFPAARGRLRPAILRAIPAFVFSILTTIISVYFCYFAPDAPPHQTPDDAADTARLFWEFWIFLSGIPLVLSLFVSLLALICNCRNKRLGR
jgi:hypothetical protein